MHVSSNAQVDSDRGPDRNEGHIPGVTQIGGGNCAQIYSLGA